MTEPPQIDIRWTARRVARGLKRRATSILGRSLPTTPPFDRRAVLLEGVDRTMRILEIGPSYSPLTPRADGWNVCTVDHASRDELVRKYSDLAHKVDVSRIEEVDVVWRGGSLEEAIGPERSGFDVCLASHVIEHTPDLIAFVRGVTRVLAPDGWLSLAVPDFRYCFDLLRPPTRVGELVAAHVERASRHSLATLIDQRAYPVRKGPETAWGQTHTGELTFIGSLADVTPLLASRTAEGSAPEYVDAHVWRFTPASFELAILELSTLGLLDVHVASLHDTVGCEFFVKLRRGRRVPETPEEVDATRIALLERSVREVAAVWATVGS